MPLKAAGDFAWVHTKTHAVCFYMHTGTRIIQCAVSVEALAAMVRRKPRNNVERMEAFAHCRKRIEQLTSANFDRGGEEPITVTPFDIQ